MILIGWKRGLVVTVSVTFVLLFLYCTFRWKQNCKLIVSFTPSLLTFCSKSLKVADLRQLLTKAQVAVPQKANKQDLITRIIGSSAAVQVFNAQFTKKASVSNDDDLVRLSLRFPCVANYSS